jgi:hypothetical protein
MKSAPPLFWAVLLATKPLICFLTAEEVRFSRVVVVLQFGFSDMVYRGSYYLTVEKYR